MQILIPDSWLKEFLETDASPRQIQEALSLCGPSIERLHKTGNDHIYDIEVTTNRVDMMSVIGIAREAAAILPHFDFSAKLANNPFNKNFSLPASRKVNYLDVQVDPKLCHRFTAVLIKNVSVKPSPEWLTKRLELVGMRGLDNVVDISNYLTHELGQPVHTFDYDKITSSQMILRESKKGETITILDHKTHVLPGGDIVIEDGSGSLIDLCGIMGGLNSAVDKNTKNVLLFVQTYEPARIRQTSMALAHRTQAAVLFEKNLPTELVEPTIETALQLFKELTGGIPEKNILDITSAKQAVQSIKLHMPITDFVNIRLGIDLEFPQIKQILSTLGLEVVSEKEISIPFWRKQDITIPEDIVEEVARIYGYHNLPTQLMAGLIPTYRDNKPFYWESKIKSALSHWGFAETYTYSLVSRELEKNPQALRLKNPLSVEWEYLRTSLTPSHLKILSENIGKADQLNFFEIANVYLPQKNRLPAEEMHLIISTTNLDYYRLKGVIEALLQEMGIKSHEINIVTHSRPPALTCELNLSHLYSLASTVKTYTPISKYSPLIEDVNITSSDSYTSLVQKIKSISPLIKKIELVDKYGDKLTLRITYHSPDKQLSSGDIKDIRLRLSSLNF